MTGLRIIAHGTPASQGSKNSYGKNLVESDKQLPAWRAAVKAAAKLAAGPNWEPIDDPVKIAGEIRIRKPRTTSLVRMPADSRASPIARSKFHNHPAGPKDLDKMQRPHSPLGHQKGLGNQNARTRHHHHGGKVKTRHATQIRYGITEARAGNNLNYRVETPLTARAFIRTLHNLARKELCYILDWQWRNDGNGPKEDK